MNATWTVRTEGDGCAISDNLIVEQSQRWGRFPTYEAAAAWAATKFHTVERDGLILGFGRNHADGWDATIYARLMQSAPER